MPEGAGGTCAQGPRAGPGLPSAVGTAWGMPQASAPVPACPDGATPRPPQRPGHPQQTPAAPRMSRASRHRCHMPFPIPHAGSHPMGAVVARSREGAHARARAPSSPRPTHSYRNLRIRNRRTKRSTPVNFRVQSGGNPHARGGGVWLAQGLLKHTHWQLRRVICLGPVVASHAPSLPAAAADAGSHSGVELWWSRTGKGSSGGRKKGMV